MQISATFFVPASYQVSSYMEPDKTFTKSVFKGKLTDTSDLDDSNDVASVVQ